LLLAMVQEQEWLAAGEDDRITDTEIKALILVRDSCSDLVDRHSLVHCILTK
jgi:hypothetical protein